MAFLPVAPAGNTSIPLLAVLAHAFSSTADLHQVPGLAPQAHELPAAFSSSQIFAMSLARLDNPSRRPAAFWNGSVPAQTSSRDSFSS